jgi:hypothetical protein
VGNAPTVRGTRRLGESRRSSDLGIFDGRLLCDIRERQFAELAVLIVRFIDEYQPGIAACDG